MKKILKKTARNAALLLTVAITLAALMGCKDDPDPTPTPTPNPQNPIEVKFNAPNTNLGGQQITLVFPYGFDVVRQNAIKAKFIAAMDVLNTTAGGDAIFKDKVNAVLDKGLVIIIEETNSLTYGTKVLDNKLIVETAFVEGTRFNGTEVDGTDIADEIIWQINNDKL